MNYVHKFIAGSGGLAFRRHRKNVIVISVEISFDPNVGPSLK